MALMQPDVKDDAGRTGDSYHTPSAPVCALSEEGPTARWRSHAPGLEAAASVDGSPNLRGTHQSSFAGSSSGEGFAGEGSSCSASLASMVKRRRSRSWASGAGLTLIATTRRSSEAPSFLFCSFVRVASFKSLLSSRLRCVRHRCHSQAPHSERCPRNQCGERDSRTLSPGRDYAPVIPFEGLHRCNPQWLLCVGGRRMRRVVLSSSGWLPFIQPPRYIANCRRPKLQLADA